MIRNTLICTVGTSMFYGNLRHLNADNVDSQPANWQALKTYYEAQNWSALSKELLKLPPDTRTCGAEINTINEIISKDIVDVAHLHFLVSDTLVGRQIGEVLVAYFRGRRDLNIKDIEVYIISDLQDQNPNLFKTRGLRNLVRSFSNIIKRFPTDQVAIDATGGYKAQIAVAVLVGQALNIPVYYKHERFSTIVDFPPLPISLDFDLLGTHSDIFVHFEKGSVSSGDILPPKIQVFFTAVEIEGEEIYELNPIGQLYLETYRLRHPFVPKLKPLSEAERKAPSFGKHHRLPDFETYVIKVWSENKWIQTCKAITFSGQRSIKGNGFSVKYDDNQQKYVLVGTYRSEHGRRFEIILSDSSRPSLNWAADYLNRSYN